jgi:hypothetical protein
MIKFDRLRKDYKLEEILPEIGIKKTKGSDYFVPGSKVGFIKSQTIKEKVRQLATELRRMAEERKRVQSRGEGRVDITHQFNNITSADYPIITKWISNELKTRSQQDGFMVILVGTGARSEREYEIAKEFQANRVKDMVDTFIDIKTYCEGFIGSNSDYSSILMRSSLELSRRMQEDVKRKGRF